MDAMATSEDEAHTPAGCDPYLRESMCVGSKRGVLRHTDAGFREEVSQRLESAESWMLERSVQLKRRLRNATTHDFWQLLMEGMSDITGSQYAFVAKRVICDDENLAVEMPPIGESGSCLMGLAFYFNNHKGQKALFRDYKHQVYGCPCQWMRHDRVLLIPEGLTALTPNNPNAEGFPIPAEGYLAVPLFHEGKCFAHFGCLWTADGLKERPNLSWGMLEMFLHALEDQVSARMLEGLGPGDKEVKTVIPQNLVTGGAAVKHSLRPYARRLSHELRTPMQGVVGMLDVMYASVLEATNPDRWRWPDLEQLREVIEGLKSSIEVAQDSSKRAVDAADNMVHAYDFNMELPSTPSQPKGVVPEFFGLSAQSNPFEFSRNSSNSAENEDDSHRRNVKRRRSSVNSGRESPHKIPHIESPSQVPVVVESGCKTPPQPPASANTSHSLMPQHGISNKKADGALDYFSQGVASGQTFTGTPSGQTFPGTPGLYYDAVGKVVLNSRPLKLRELLHEAVTDSLRTGGRPDFTKFSGTPRGERVTVEVTEAHSGDEERKLVEIEVIVEETVPDSIIIDGSYLMKMICSVFHNAFKFTPSGRITLNATVNTTRQIIFSIIDTGDGIPSDFIPDLFKPFSTEDESLTRHRDGLGLGLYVARGIARKMGGDLWLERTATEGENRGSEFRIRLPITPADASESTPNTPVPTPGSIPDPTASLRSETAPLSRIRPPSPLVTPLARKLSFDPDLAKKLPLRILVVEDNRINRALLCSMLRRLGYRDIEEARDGVEAVEIFSAALRASPSDPKRAFDLILMDLWMPQMDGYEAAERIVKLYNEKMRDCSDSDRFGAGITVLAVSADATEEARAKAALRGIHGFVGKPFGIADLGKAVMDFRGKDVFGERRLSTVGTTASAS